MKPLRLLIVDDEPLARSGLRALLANDTELECVSECGDGQAAIEAIESLMPDLVLLDVQMPEIDGFGVIRAIGPERMPAVIFVTAYEEFALEAFRVHALDYLLKPFSDAQLADALTRAKRLIRDQGIAQLGDRLNELSGRRRIAVRSPLEVRRLPCSPVASMSPIRAVMTGCSQPSATTGLSSASYRRAARLTGCGSSIATG